MTTDERRAGWLARVFGGSTEAQADGQPPQAESVDPALVIKELEDELQRARSAYEELVERATEAEAELEAARRDREIARSHANAAATKIAGLLDARRAQEGRINSQVADLEAARGEASRGLAELATAHGELAKLRDELARARTDLTKERARTASVQASTRQVVATYDTATKRAQEQRTVLEQERDAALRTVGEERAAREVERRAAASALAEATVARRRAEMDSARVGSLLRGAVERGAQALELALGRGASLALRAVAGHAHASAPGEAAIELSEAVEGLATSLRAAGWVERASLVEDDGGGARVTLELGDRASGVAARALIALEAEAWLRARSGRSTTIALSDLAAKAPRDRSP
jgi:hypothetical protein